MKQQDRNPKQTRLRATRLGVLAATLLCLGLLSAAPASANYEQVGTFAGTPGELHSFAEGGKWPEEVQLGGVGGMAVNYTGAGGVEPGTVYVAEFASVGTGRRVAMFDPKPGGGLAFNRSWEVTAEPSPSYPRCGPGLPVPTACAPRGAAAAGFVDVDVDQSTGNLYVLNAENPQAGRKMVIEYTPDGESEITRFAETAPAGKTTAETPDQIHRSFGGGLAVNAAGEVYVLDETEGSAGFYHRLMVFKPQSPNDYEHYVYAGQGKDVAAGFGTETVRPRMPVADAAGNIYTVGGTVNSIAKLNPSTPAAPPLCEFSFPKGHIESITVIPATGEVFFYTDTDRKIHRLGPCKEGKFSEAGTFGFAPPRVEFSAMAFDPAAQFGPGRPAGTLYAGDPNGSGGKTEGEPPNTKFESPLGYIFALPKELPPEVKSESVEHVTSTTADLGAQINPKGPPTTYVFQYIAQAQYEANEPADRFAGAAESPPGGALLGEGPDTLSTSTSLTKLQPDTTYHYRAVATSHCSEELPEKVCEGAGADQTFHTFPIEAPGLPDKRVYELVSPAEKEGGQVLPADSSVSSCASSCKPGQVYVQFPRQSTPEGEAITYEGTPFAGGEGAVRENQYISRRDAKAGWQTVNLTPPLLNNLFEGRGYRAFDTTLSRGVLSQGSPTLSLEAPAGYRNLYTQPTANPLALEPLLAAEPPNRSTAELRLIYADASADLSRIFFEANDALTAETAFAPEAVDGGPSKYNLYEWTEGELRLVNVLPGNAATLPGASLGSGTLLKSGNSNVPVPVHTQAISEDGSHAFWSSESGQLYVRIDGTETVEVKDHVGKFLVASKDGSKVLLSDGCLYDLPTEGCEDLAAGKGGFLGVTGHAEDLSHVFFVDTAVLDEEANANGDKAQAGKPNLYAWAEGASTFVATLAAADNNNAGVGDWTAATAVRTAEASPSGRYLAFLSRAQITGYDNTGPCPFTSGATSGPCPEAFLYDSATNELTCASCNPSGTRPLGRSSLRLINGGSNSLPQPRYLTDEGRLYFDSRDSLSPFDTNNGVEDVYQYEPQGLGTCEREGGCVSLISAGSEPEDSNFLAMDEDGANVFFTSRDQLVLKDHDDLIDLYDARVEGGIPSETEVARSECQGEACVATYSPPNDPTPGSSSFEGAGNVDEKKNTKKHKKKKKHAKKHKSHKRSHGRAAKHNRGGAK